MIQERMEGREFQLLEKVYNLGDEMIEHILLLKKFRYDSGVESDRSPESYKLDPSGDKDDWDDFL